MFLLNQYSNIVHVLLTYCFKHINLFLVIFMYFYVHLMLAYSKDEQQCRRQLEQASRRLTTLQSARKDKMMKFGRQMPEALRKIEEAVRRGRFHERPRGPVGESSCIHIILISYTILSLLN